MEDKVFQTQRFSLLDGEPDNLALKHPLSGEYHNEFLIITIMIIIIIYMGNYINQIIVFYDEWAVTWTGVESMVNPVKDETSIKDIVVEWNGGKARGFRSIDEAERFIKKVCRRAAPDFKYSIYKYM